MPAVVTKVFFSGDIRQLAGCRQVVVTLPERSTVNDLLSYLRDTFGEAFAKRLFDTDGRIYSEVIVSINEMDYKGLGGLQAVLPGGEVRVLILPQWDGG